MRKDYLTRFKQAGEVPLEKTVTGVRLTPEIGEAVRSLPSSERSAWLRRVISEAVKRELIDRPV